MRISPTPHPDRVRAIALRELTATQQVLSHGIPDREVRRPRPPASVPVVRGPDGDALAAGLLPLLGEG